MPRESKFLMTQVYVPLANLCAQCTFASHRHFVPCIWGCLLGTTSGIWPAGFEKWGIEASSFMNDFRSPTSLRLQRFSPRVVKHSWVPSRVWVQWDYSTGFPVVSILEDDPGSLSERQRPKLRKVNVRSSKAVAQWQQTWYLLKVTSS